MSGMTLGLLAESTLKMALGGRMAVNESAITLRQVAQWLSEYRDMLIQNRFIKGGDDQELDEGLFTDHGILDTAWDARLGMYAVEVPGGMPPYISFMKGLRVYPASGGGMLIPVTPHFFDINPRLYHFEGNRAWEIRGSRLVFPNSGLGDLLAVQVSSIVTGISDVDAEIPMPSNYAAQCREMVVDRIRQSLGLADSKQDGLKDGTQK